MMIRSGIPFALYILPNRSYNRIVRIIVTRRKAALAICDYTPHISEGRMTRIEGR